MSDRYRYSQWSAYGEATNDTGAVELISNPGSATYLYIEKGIVSVYKPAAGAGGVVQLKDTLGNVIWQTNADGVKDVELNFGDTGLQVGPDKGLQLITAGAGTAQASASVALTGHYGYARP